jgi:DNA-binding transcriptional MerR regulator
VNKALGIRQLAYETGVTPHTLRYYEDAGLMIPVERNTRGRRVYTADHVRWVRFLVRLREGGMGIKRIREYVDLLSHDADPEGTKRLAILVAHRDQVRDRVERLQEHLAILDKKVEAGCRPADPQPSSRSTP